jgi:hypothetical protein
MAHCGAIQAEGYSMRLVASVSLSWHSDDYGPQQPVSASGAGQVCVFSGLE